MLSYLDIIEAINGSIKSVFPDIEIQSNDIKEGFSRPSFFVDFENIKASKLNMMYKNTNIPVTVYYFPQSATKNQIENLSIQSELENAFLEPLLVCNTFYLSTSEVESQITDGVLQIQFELEYYEEIEADQTVEVMDELNIELRKEG